MAFIIKKNNPFINTKLTQKGREKLAQGLLNFKFWGIGDSEVNYDREAEFETIPNNTNTSRILKSVDKQPNIKYFVYKNNSSEYIYPLNSGDIKTLKLTINNNATERGFFNNLNDLGFTFKTESEFSISNGVINPITLSGSTTLDIPFSGSTSGDILMLKLTNDVSSGITINDNNTPLPVLFYEIIDVSGTTITVNRDLPNLSGNSTNINYFIFPGGEIHETELWGSDIVAYWNNETLTFDSSCDVSRSDVPILNFTIINIEDLAGYFNFNTLDSNPYIGLMENYLSYNDSLNSNSEVIVDPCTDILTSGYIDNFIKSIGVIHYTNNTISNFYGDFFHIDPSNGKNLVLDIPHILYHRRNNVNDLSLGSRSGMSFISYGEEKTILDTDIIYFDLIENPDYVVGRDPLVVGKVIPQLKLVIIENSELLMAMSQHTNRNWTTPNLSGRLINSINGANNGLLEVNKKIFITYSLSTPSNSGLNYPIHNGNYLVIENKSLSSKDVEFSIEDTDLLVFMRDKSDINYDGLGFFAESFDVIYQIVDIDSRPIEGQWKKLEFNSNIMGSGVTISPSLLENQLPSFNNQSITITNDALSSNYDYPSLVGQLSTTKRFGSETFFMGNLNTSIGSTIYKTIFDLKINSNEFTKTSNPTRDTNPISNPPALRVTEIGIYDGDGDLVMIGKLSQPIILNNGSTALIELSMDF